MRSAVGVACSGVRWLVEFRGLGYSTSPRRRERRRERPSMKSKPRDFDGWLNPRPTKTSAKTSSPLLAKYEELVASIIARKRRD